MATSDDLRGKLAEAIEDARLDVTWQESPAVDVWTCETAEDLADALMPVVVEALAQAWDDGHRTANPTVPDKHRDVINPWKQP